jgi:type III secretion protein V
MSGSPTPERALAGRTHAEERARPFVGPGIGRATKARIAPKKSPLGVADMVLAGFVIAIVSMMIMPLPTPLLDVLLAANLSISVTVLLVVLYVPDALSIATFPTLLLLTTLFRLALNVSSARLILLQANAGEVIAAFGTFVVRGNYVVGAVVFLILTIIQFVVITKGSERVAEVGARFVLDAMPGKQMAIDAEVRTGTIDSGEARKRRHKLSRESQFYGAMDGAMKFVKGDVIASVIITVVNILGGLAIGMLQKDLAAGIALKKYGLLTIGDGLVSQIPALILSTAAGVLVTRTASEDPDTPLGQELGRQLFGTPRALTVASVFIVGLGLVPGLPAVPFALMGGLLFFVARTRTRSIAAAGTRAALEPSAQSKGIGRPEFVPIVVPWAIELSEDLAPLAFDTTQRSGLSSLLVELREDLFRELGVPLPAPRVQVLAHLQARSAALSLFEVPTRTIELPATVMNPANAGGSVASDESVLATIIAASREILARRAADFLGLAETQRLLDSLEGFAGATVRNVVPKPISIVLLTDILRRLLEEGVSIRDLRGILEGLSTVATHEKDPLLLAEYLRGQMRRSFTHRFTQDTGTLSAFTLDSIIEDTIRRAITRTSAGAFLALAPAAARDITTAVRRAFAEGPATHAVSKQVILTQPDIRRFVRKLLEPDFPDLHVLSFPELMPEVSVCALGKAHLGGIG